MNKLKLVRVGNSLGVILPKNIIAGLDIDKGDTLFAVRTDAGVELTPYDPEFERRMHIAERLMKMYRNSLRYLAR